MTAVICYTYYETASSICNLDFFVKNEINYREDVDYILVINGMKCQVSLPNLKNVTIIKRENTGYDFGGHYIALNYIRERNLEYEYFIFMNSGVIGPIVPHYVSSIHWSKYFINKINDKVKLVGTTIVCLPESDAGGYGPKVEGFFFVTDKVGLAIIEKEKTVFQIHEDKYSAIVNGEYGLSRCILKNGYSIDCMIKKYQNIDWTDRENWNLNNYKHPSRKNSFFENSLIPYELIFHKWYWKSSDVNYDTENCSFEIIKQYIDNNC
tara:strand:- start:3254 stop:4051 length:798 start_codon:yes stop_codon:yes gene_type:complete